jgi:outer membrane receptor protein involved in Fe transport
MHRHVAPVVLAVAVALAAAPPAAAQFANSDLVGTVTDAQGKALPGVVVTARNEATGIARSTVAAATGNYALLGLSPGTYTVTYQLEGFRSREETGVELRVGQETRIAVALELGAVEEQLTVVGTAPVVELTSKEIGGTLTAQEFDALPTQNRSALLFAALMPGVIPVPSTESTSADALFINGQDDNNNSFNIDGANNDDDVIGARAGAQARTPMEAIQEFQVLTTQYDAEFGRALGGVLNAVTKSGTNRFRGSAFAFLQDSGYNEKNFFTERAGLPQPESEFRSLGFTVGGPVVRDRAHFFVSYEDNLDESGIAREFATRPEFNFSTTEQNDIDNYLIRLDYQPFSNQHLIARYLLEESPQFNQIVGAVTQAAAREESDTDSSWVLSLDSVLGARVFNTARLSWAKEDVAFANPGFNANGQSFEAQRNQSVSEVHPGFTDGASTVAQARVNTSLQLDDTASLFLPDWHGEHELRVGFQYSEREESFTDFGFLNGQFFNFLSDAPFDPADISTYPGAFSLRVLGGLTADIPGNETLGVFVQDDWRLSGRLTLNLGLRFDREDITEGDDLSPRVGFTWDPAGRGRTVVRGGYGRFYDRFQMGFYQNFFLDAITITQGFIVRQPSAGVDRQFFFDLARANGVTTLDGLRDLLAGMIEGGAGAILNSFPTVDNPGRRQSYADSVSLGAEHEIWPGVAAAVDLVRTETKDGLLLVDLNPSSAAQGGRPNVSILDGQPIALGSVSTWVNAGDNAYDAVQLSLRRRIDRRWGGRISYTWARSEGNNEGGEAGTPLAYFQRRTETGYDFDRGVVVGQPLDLNLGDPRLSDVPVNWHRDHNLVVSGTYVVPGTSWRDNGGLVVSGIYRYLSGDRETLFVNGFLDNGNRAPAPAGTYDPTNPSDIGSGGTRFDGKLDGAENPDFSRLDLSLRYRLPVGGRVVATVLADVFNVFDETNFETVGGNIVGTGAFLVPNTAFNPREIQLGVRVEF